MPVTIFDLAVYRLKARDVEVPEDGSLNGGHFEQVGLPIMGGCQGCEATVAAYNAHPSKTGFLRCGDCIGDLGWDDVAQANHDIFQ